MALPKPDGPGSPRFEESAAELRAMARAMSQVKVVRRWSAESDDAERRRRRAPGAQPASSSPWRHRPAGPPRAAPHPHGPAAHLPRADPRGAAHRAATSPRASPTGWRQLRAAVKLASTAKPLRRARSTSRPTTRTSAWATAGQLSARAHRRVPPVGDVPLRERRRALRPRMVAVVLTGMGSDGADGLAAPTTPARTSSRRTRRRRSSTAWRRRRCAAAPWTWLAPLDQIARPSSSSPQEANVG
jgi:hypothetical protein